MFEIQNQLKTCCIECINLDFNHHADINEIFCGERVVDRALILNIGCRHHKVCKLYIESSEDILKVTVSETGSRREQ